MWRRIFAAMRQLRTPSVSTGFVGAVAAIAVAVLTNLFGVRFDRRWDLTTDQRYTPSIALGSLLKHLREEVTVTVLLANTDPSAQSVRQLLTSYRSITRNLSLDWVDPDRDPARFLSKQSELGLQPGHTEDGTATSDAILVVSRENRRNYIQAQDILELDPDASETTAHFEHAFTLALRSVLERTSPIVCFSEGHRELSTLDQSLLGLSRLKQRLEQEAMLTKVVDLGQGEKEPLRDCRLVIVAAPDVALSPSARKTLAAATRHSSLLLLGGVVPDAEGRLVGVGFDSLAQLSGIRLGTNVVIERDESFRLPNLFGETFYATPGEHPTTKGLVRQTGGSPLRVVVSLAQSLEKEPDSRASILLSSSANAIALTNVSQAAVEGAERQHADATRSHIVAAAGPVPGACAECQVALTPANIFQNRTFENKTLLVTESFGISLVSWLVSSNTAPVEFEPRPARAAEFDLSAEDLADIARYTVFVMPGCFLLLGLSVLWMRRHQPRREAAEDRGAVDI